MLACFYGDRLREGLDGTAGNRGTVARSSEGWLQAGYQETVGGGTMDRPELEKCLERLDKGDTLIVWRLDRLGRSIRDLLQIVDRLDKSGINFISLKEKFDTSTAAGRLVFHFFATLTQFEKELIRERTMAGLSSARVRGRMGGRKKLLTAQQAKVVKTMWDSHEHTRHEIAANFSVSVATIDRLLRASRSVAASGGGK